MPKDPTIRPDPSTLPFSSDARTRSADPDADTVVPPERRARPGPRDPRYTYDVPMAFSLYGRRLTGRIRDIGVRGAFVRCDPPPPVDAVLAFDLLTPGGVVPVRGRVVRTRTRENHPDPGFGFAFEDLDRGVPEVIENLLAQLGRRGAQPGAGSPGHGG